MVGQLRGGTDTQVPELWPWNGREAQVNRGSKTGFPSVAEMD